MTDDASLQLWRDVLDPTGSGLLEALAGEIAEYTREPLPTVLDKMALGTAALKQLWEAQGIDPNDPTAVAGFYREQFVEAYELADWHAGRTTGTSPLKYAWAAVCARTLGLKRVLDFGSGIGSGTLCFAAQGCDVTAGDIALELLRFVEFRLRRRGWQARCLDLQQVRPAGPFDLIACFDVLEHLPDQYAQLRAFESWLRPDGYLFVNLMVDSTDADRPMHISSAGDPLALIRRTGLTPVWELFRPGVQVLKRTRWGRWRNRVARLVDGWQRLGQP